MMVRRFKDSDYAMISSWYTKRNMKPMSRDLLPAFGFIVEDIAASFMYVADGKLALLEGSITNPSQPKEQRTQAMLQIFTGLTSHAKELGLKRMYSVTRLPVIADYAKQFGWVVKPGSITLVKELN